MPRAAYTKSKYSTDLDLVLNLPLYETGLKENLFVSYDSYAHKCAVTDATWTPQGRTFVAATKDCISVPVLLTPPYTLILWAKCTVLPSVAGTGFSFTDGATVNTCAFSLTATDRIYFYNGSDVLYASPDPTLTSWHMYTAVVNGASSSITVDNGTPVTGTMAATAITTLLLGKNGNDTVFLSGILSQVCIYNRALSVVEIMQIYLATKWRFT